MFSNYLIYRDKGIQFRVTIYRQENVQNPLTAHYYYNPALILDPGSAVCSFNSFIKRHEVTFSVITWDEEFENFVISESNRKLGSILPRSNL
ncbi:hypothetical protein BV898_04159 [Hypsibius exemplaris]|uniref:Uncharacterized protein n=1 Tax=Hypsibius exemplaris TaxID=2072580 RepID=A0A1W0X326_HYPEX|nr:hypothetical protein BV898_04159 [Hypsibius exemplaris]